MTTNVNQIKSNQIKSNDVLVVVCFFDVTKPASICNHKKFRNHENDSLAVTFENFKNHVKTVGSKNTLATYQSVHLTFLFDYRYFFGEFLADKIRRRIRLSAAAWRSRCDAMMV